jgi:two-component system phosphate regulon sensor histidine kinase PhoR
MLPLLGTLLLSLQATIVLCVLTIISFLIFAAGIGDISDEITKDLFIFFVFTQVFILFLAWQRNRLEADRQNLVIEQERNTLLKQLITNLSHDFRTPLTTIITSVYLAGRIKDDVQRQEKLDQIQGQALRLNRMVEDILTMSALDQPQDHCLELVNINEVLATLYRQAAAPAQQKDIRLLLDLDAKLEPSLMHSVYIRRALTSLVDNAITYTEHGGCITFRSFQEDTHAVIEIKDAGIGISAQDLPAIFTPFFRVDQARSVETGGMGLGLAIARQAVELHGGTITVESEVGVGSTFRVRIPWTPARHS